MGDEILGQVVTTSHAAGLTQFRDVAVTVVARAREGQGWTAYLAAQGSSPRVIHRFGLVLPAADAAALFPELDAAQYREDTGGMT